MAFAIYELAVIHISRDEVNLFECGFTNEYTYSNEDVMDERKIVKQRKMSGKRNNEEKMVREGGSWKKSGRIRA